WKLGTVSGSNTLSVTCGAAPTINFSATGNPDVAAAISISAGNNQSAKVNTNVTTAPAIMVVDQFGNAVANNTPVGFTLTSGGGSIVGGTTSTTNGVATLGSWKLGQTVGTNTLNATSGAITPLVFTATGTPDVAASITVSAGNAPTQTATVNTNVAIAPAV